MMRTPSTTGLAALMLGAIALGANASDAPPAEAASGERVLVLGGGALGICSELAVDACTGVVRANAALTRRYRIDAAGIERALDPDLWHATPGATREALAPWLAAARARAGAGARDVDALDALLARPRDGRDPPWNRLTDGERAGVRSAFEMPSVDAAGERIRERAFPGASRDRAGVAVIDAFIAAARVRAKGERPRIAFVTASAADPMESVDFYSSLFEATGARAEWWPIDAAVAAARFDPASGGCEALPALRARMLGLSDRRRVYPDLDAAQRRYCAERGRDLPDAHGVFFAGGDQWRLRRAFFAARDRPNPWLESLRARFASGAIAVGGTSAGSAVQSGAWMLGNGTSGAALRDLIVEGAPPEPGCGRAGRCGAARDEDALALVTGGGLGLAREAIVDTHFSERARELRLVLAMAAAGARFGYGVDEGSALVVRDDGDTRRIDAVGRHGGWVFARHSDEPMALRAWYLAPGATLALGTHGITLTLARGVVPTPGRARDRRATTSALEPEALRNAAWTLADGEPEAELTFDDGGMRTTLRRDATTRTWRGANGATGIGPMTLSLTPIEAQARLNGGAE